MSTDNNALWRLAQAVWLSLASRWHLAKIRLLSRLGLLSGPAAWQELTQQPILSNSQIIDYAQQLEQLAGKAGRNQKQSEALRQGEQSSRFMGAGLEYEESRLYQPGDEIRRINWRLMARTGQAYTKLFQEERQESWFILIDQRATMRFGSRQHLKVTQALKVAGYFAWLAQQQGLPISAARIAETVSYTPSFEGKSSYLQLMQALSLPCPPMNFQQQDRQPRLNDVLIRLKGRLNAGTRLLIISDFIDMDAQSIEILTALQDQVAIKAVMINDPLEQQLPTTDGLQLQSISNGEIYQISGQQQANKFKLWAEQQQQLLLQQLQQANASCYQVSTAMNLSAMNQALHPQGMLANSSLQVSGVA